MTNAEKRGDHPDHYSINADRSSYTCLMHPEVRSAYPGTCPKCGMTLVLIEKSEDGVMNHHKQAMKPTS